MNRIDIRLIVHPNGKLTAVDDFSYNEELSENLDNYISIEFLEFVPKHKICVDSAILTEYKHLNDHLCDNNEFVLHTDGLWKYYKFMVPVLDYLVYDDNSGICVTDQLYFFRKNGRTGLYRFKYDMTDEQIWEMGQNSYEVLQYVKDNSIEVTNFAELLEYKEHAFHTFYCEKIVFSICNLTKCFVNLHRQLMEKEYRYECSELSDLKRDRDFLLCSIHVLDYLKDMKEFEEAQRILDNLVSCNSFCGDVIENDCHCNG